MKANGIRFVFFGVFLLIFLLSETQFTGSPAEVSAITDAQRKEIEDLRAELNEAFDRDEEADDDDDENEDVIVQPQWTRTSEQKVTGKVVVTKKDKEEVKALRDEINTAVHDNRYFSELTDSLETDPDAVQQLIQKYSKEDHARTILREMMGATADDESVGASMEPEQTKGEESEEPNVVEVAVIEPDIDIRKLQSIEYSKRRTKEMLILESIESDMNFRLGEDVLAWAHIMHNHHEYFVGQQEASLLIVRRTGVDFYKNSDVVEVGEPISHMETYSFWNPLLQHQEGIILIACGDKVQWYRTNNTTGHIQLYWEWGVGRTVSGITHFASESHDYLVVSSNVSFKAGYYTLSIYQYDLESKEFWIAQLLQLTHPCTEVAMLDTGRDLILAVPQKNSAIIYAFNPHTHHEEQTHGHVRFRKTLTIDSRDIQSIAAFQMGGRSYLALTGHQPQILLYQHGHFVPKTILDSNFGLVELFFPIPVRTYRDDLILLVQHRVDFSTHSLTELDALIWQGDNFETSLPVPCLFGPHTVYGVSCVLDIERDEGLKGAALLRRGNETSIIVPRNNAESGLFRLHTKLLGKNSELLDLQDIFDFLKDWVIEHDDYVAKAEAFLAAGTIDEPKTEPDFSGIEAVKATEFTFGGKVGEVHLNDHKWSEDDSEINLETLIENIEEFGRDFFSGDRQRRSPPGREGSLDQLEVDELEVEELRVERVNGDPFYIQNGALNFEGLLRLHHLEVRDRLRQQRQLSGNDSLEIDGDLELVEINGVPWSDIRDNLVFRDRPMKLDNLVLDGELIVEDELTVHTLNSLKFPSEFLWSNGVDAVIVDAEKDFRGTLEASAVDTEGIINGVDPFDAIVLSEPQKWDGLPTFAHLHISERLEHNGTVQTLGLKNFTANLNLEESHNISALCHFETLEIDGPIYVNGHFEGLPMGSVLSDIVQRPSNVFDEIVMRGEKSFSTLQLPIDTNILDSRIANEAVDNFVTLHTVQDLNITIIQGMIYFLNLSLDGSFDGVDVNDLMRSSVRINTVQNLLNTQLNFAQPIQAERVEVVRSLNGLPIARNFQTTIDDLEIEEIEFQELQTKVAYISNDTIGTGRLNGLDLDEFVRKRNWTQASDVGNIFVDELVVGGDLIADAIHGIKMDHLMDFLEQIDELPEMILDGKILVDEVLVTGDVQVHKLNQMNFDEDIQLPAVWLNRPNYLTTSLEFDRPMELYGDLRVEGTLNEDNFTQFLEDLVFRGVHYSPVVFSATKSFAMPVEVLDDTIVDSVNGVPFTAVATKRLNVPNFLGRLQINGRLAVDELELNGNLNNQSMAELSAFVEFNEQKQGFVLKGDILFPNQTYLQDLTVEGSLNDMTDLEEFFNDLVYKNTSCYMEGNKTFTGRVSIRQGLQVVNLNGHNFQQLLGNMVFNDEEIPITVDSPIAFQGEVLAQMIRVVDSLTASHLNNCSLDEWINNTIRLDKNEDFPHLVTLAPGSVHSPNLQVNFLNGINLSDVITLHTPQKLTGALNFSTVFLDGEINVASTVNGVDLRAEYENTLLIAAGDQHISTPLTLPTVLVLNNLETRVPVNDGYDLEQVATLHGDQFLESRLFFEDVATPQLETNDLVSGINLDQWMNETVSVNDPSPQLVTGHWNVRHLTVKATPILFRQGEEQSPSMDCSKIRRTGLLKHLEESFNLEAPDTEIFINQAFILSDRRRTFLLMNTGCESTIYKWFVEEQKFNKLDSFSSGYIDEVWIMTNKSSESTFQFMTSASEETDCRTRDTNSWRILRNTITQQPLESFDNLDPNDFQLPESTQTKRTTSSTPFSRPDHGSADSTVPSGTLISSNQNSIGEQVPVMETKTFGDLQQTVASILTELGNRLHLEIDVTQLSIPESDLYDEHLIVDFLAIMEELQKQQIYPADMFTDLNLDNFQMPDSPAKVLAVRTVHIIWPAIIDIEEVQKYLQINGSAEEQICECISNRLGETVKNVLQIANSKVSNQTQLHSSESLSRVVEYLHTFRRDLDAFTKELQPTGVKPHNETAASQRAAIETLMAEETRSLITGISDMMPPRPDELITFEVGPTGATRTLVAVIASRSQLGNGSDQHVNVYSSLLGEGHLFQSIICRRPRFLQTVRIRDETMLIILEDCCSIRVLVYRGLQGFVDFARFNTATRILKLMSVQLPNADETSLRYFAVAALAKRITFYEFVLAKRMVPADAIGCGLD